MAFSHLRRAGPLLAQKAPAFLSRLMAGNRLKS
jgi:hypothetical protein